MRQLSRLLALCAVLLGLLPCEMREALPVVGGLVSACCADEVEAGEHEDASVDCCDAAACLGAARATLPVPFAETMATNGYLLVDEPVRVDRPTWRAGPPPTPPPRA